jgi:hypothetical protein
VDGGVDGGMDRGNGRNTLGHQLQGALSSLRQGQQSLICQHTGRKSSNVSFEYEFWTEILRVS